MPQHRHQRRAEVVSLKGKMFKNLKIFSFSSFISRFFDIPENDPDMENVLDVVKDCVETSLKNLVDRTNIEIHVIEGSKDKVLSWQTDPEYGLFWAVLNYPACSSLISTSLDLLDRVSSPPLPLTPVRSPRLRLSSGSEVGVQYFL